MIGHGDSDGVFIICYGSRAVEIGLVTAEHII